MVIPRQSLQVATSPGRKRGHRQPVDAVATGVWPVLTLSVLLLVTAGSTAGCGGAETDEFEIVNVSDIVTSPQSPAASGTLSGSSGSVGQNTAGSTAVPDTTTHPDTGTDSRSGLSEDTGSEKTSVPAGTGSETDGSESGTSTESDTENKQAGAGRPVNTAAGEPLAGGQSQTEPSVLPVVEPAVREPREVRLLIPEKTFREEGREKALRVSFDDIDLLKVLNMEPVQADAPDLMPGWLKGLEGRRIRIRGFMYPTFQDTDIKVFILARDNQICCFGRSPKVYDLIKISMQEGRTTDYIPNRPFDLIGTFHIAEQAETAEDALPRLYSIDDASIIVR